MRTIIFVVVMLLTLVIPARAAELPDPWKTLRWRDAIVSLGALREPLDAAPDDQRLLGLAIMAYVNLCLEVDPDLTGGFGPWYGYARELAQRRQAARHGAAPATLEDAAPELWLDLIDGDAAGVYAQVQRFPEQAQTPTARALTTMCTRDWRGLKEQKNLTAHEKFAFFRACCWSGN